MKEIKGIARAKFFPGQVEEWKRQTEQAMVTVGPGNNRDQSALAHAAGPQAPAKVDSYLC